MIYIKVSNEEVQLGGTVANQRMIDEGWEQYNGEIPEGSKFSLIDGELVADLTPEREAKLKSAIENYNTLISDDVDYMETTFQADKESQDLITSVLSVGSVPDNFYWLDKENNRIEMTFLQLQGLSKEILIRSQSAFAVLQDQKEFIGTADYNDLKIENQY